MYKSGAWFGGAWLVLKPSNCTSPCAAVVRVYICCWRDHFHGRTCTSCMAGGSGRGVRDCLCTNQSIVSAVNCDACGAVKPIVRRTHRRRVWAADESNAHVANWYDRNRFWVLTNATRMLVLGRTRALFGARDLAVSVSNQTKLFNQIAIKPEHCLHYVLPTATEQSVTDCLRSANKLPRIFAKTNRFKYSFICYSLNCLLCERCFYYLSDCVIQPSSCHISLTIN